VQILDAESGRQAIATIVAEGIANDPKLGSHLAMWGRRVVGDTLLVARSAIHHTDNRNSDEQRIEPVFTEVIAAHTRRMDGLGLTA
jgi:LPS sulfotransferase NodH